MIIISVGSGGVVSAFFRFNSNSNEMNIISLLSHFNHTEKLLGRSHSAVENPFWDYIFWQHQKQSNVECRKEMREAKDGEKLTKTIPPHLQWKGINFHRKIVCTIILSFRKFITWRWDFSSLCLCVLSHPLLHTIYDFLNFKITSFLFLSFIYFLFWSIQPFVSRENRVFSAVPVLLVLSAPHTSPLPCLFPLNSLRLLVVKIQHQIKWVES